MHVVMMDCRQKDLLVHFGKQRLVKDVQVEQSGKLQPKMSHLETPNHLWKVIGDG